MLLLRLNFLPSTLCRLRNFFHYSATVPNRFILETLYVLLEMRKGGGAGSSADGLIGRLSPTVLVLLISFLKGLRGPRCPNVFLRWILTGGMDFESLGEKDTAGKDSDLLGHGLV